MGTLELYKGKNVKITDVNGKEWLGFVEEYNPYDMLSDYEGETIDVKTTDELGDVVFSVSDIASIVVE